MIDTRDLITASERRVTLEVGLRELFAEVVPLWPIPIDDCPSPWRTTHRRDAELWLLLDTARRCLWLAAPRELELLAMCHRDQLPPVDVRELALVRVGEVDTDQVALEVVALAARHRLEVEIDYDGAPRRVRVQWVTPRAAGRDTLFGVTLISTPDEAVRTFKLGKVTGWRVISEALPVWNGKAYEVAHAPGR